MNIRVGYQGSHGTFSEIAAMRYFSDRPFEQHGYHDFLSIMNDCQSGRLDYALLPVENTTTGIIARTYDLFQSYQVHAVGEINVPIEENLIVVPGTSLAEIRHVYSHPEVIGQCTSFFRSHPQLQPVLYQDTAKSVEYVRDCGRHDIAALGSQRAAEYYEMTSLLTSVQDSKSNMTRFLCVTARPEQDPAANKISAMLVLKHEPGALYRVLGVLARQNINVLKLESRPIPGKPFQYSFYIDFTGNTADAGMQQILKEMSAESESVRILGCYRAAGGPVLSAGI